QTQARLVRCAPRAIRTDPRHPDAQAWHLLELERVFQMAHQFDIIHAHLDYLPLPLARRWKTPTLTTLHGRVDLPDLVPIYDEFREAPLVSISNAQRRPLPRANWVGTVYHGIPRTLYRFNEQPGDYLAFVGRISPEKGIDRAIHVAESLKVPLKIAAKIDD